MKPLAGAKESSNHRIALLAGQALCLGLTAAWIAIPASAIFLETYGSGLLPLTYIGAAAAGAAASASLAIALRRRPLASVAMTVLTVLSVVLVAASECVPSIAGPRIAPTAQTSVPSTTMSFT